MAYSLDFSLALGPGKTGLSDLRAQLVDTTGASVGSAVSTGFVEIGTSGNYLWHYAAFPDAHRGGVKFYSNAAPTVFLLFAAINPQEGEYTDAKISVVQADTDDIQARLPAALVSGRIDASVGAIAANAITATSINADAITAAKIADGAIDAATFAAGAINAAAIATDAITAAKIAADAIGASELATDAVTEIQSGLSTLTAAGVRTAVGLATANLDTQLDALPTNTELATALAGADDATLSAIAAISVPTVADILAAVVEGSITLKGALRLMLAVLAGKSSGGGTTTLTFRDVADAKARVTATVTADGNRTAITRDITD